ncbi:VHS domain-containing protein [Pilobolus umbonatus]|nr:VHS domain-containing protein [Pilobolus umbonatus]
MPSPLVTLIEGACSPARFEPELGLNLEICEMINKKQGTAPREAASTIVRLVNSKNMSQALLALTLLDNCVKNCGYPFHLQIATKEFLNELVRKFPERPAPFPNPVVQRILYLIKEWKVALTDMSKHKDDLIHIRDMHRLLRFKGYRFPELQDASVAALAPSDSLKSAHELEEEDRLAMSAKLQELIRRGRPQDLVEANRLMKIMSGFDTRQTPDYSQKFEDELCKVQDKAILLYEMLETVKQGDNVDRNETIMDLKNASASAQPKIQKLITDGEDIHRMENLLTLNDMLNNVMAKFADIRKGIFNTHYEISGKPPTRANHDDSNYPREEPKQAISLIDLDDDPVSITSSPALSSVRAMDELSDIFGSTSVSTHNPPAQTSTTSNDLFDLFGSTSTPPSYYSVTPAPSNSSNSAIPSPSLHNNHIPHTPKVASPAPSQKPVESVILVNKNGLKIELRIEDIESYYQIKAYFSNQSVTPMDNLKLQLAAPKSMPIKMQNQTSSTLPPKSDNAVTQDIKVMNPNKLPLRLRYKVSYEQHGVEMELSGTYSS